MSNFSASKILDIAQKLLGIVDTKLSADEKDFHKAVKTVKSLNISEDSLKTASENITEKDLEAFIDYKRTLESLISGKDPTTIPTLDELSNQPNRKRKS